MTPERWQLVTELFEAASERGPEERVEFLARACGGDEELRAEVESLLATDEADPAFMNAPVGALLVDDTPALAAGQRFGQYDEICPLAAGGMGQVYVAVDTRLGRKVALKLLPSLYTNDVDRVRRFEREARAVSALNHPNIVTIHEIGQADSLHFIATEFVEGTTLRERMASTRMTMGEVLDVVAQVASALEAAHAAGVVHRDVKPENLMLRPDGFVKILDFGLAKLSPHPAAFDTAGPAGSSVKTNPGVVMGTVAYMSPEQARGEEVDARTDVWSLGVVLYEMVAGRPPFEGETANHVVVSILDSHPAPLSHTVEVPAELERIVTKALCKARAERYQTVGELALDVKNLKEELTVEARLKRFRRAEPEGREATVTNGAAVAVPGPMSRVEDLVDGIRHRRRAVIASAATFLLVATLVYSFRHSEGGAEAIQSVAVLPFVNASGDTEAEYLSDGIADSIIASLVRLPGARVVSLGAVSRYKGRQIDPQAVGQELNVRAVLTGRVTQRGDALAMDAELVDVRDNRRLWSGQYVGTASDLLAAHQQIAGGLAEGLGLRLGGTTQRRLTNHDTEIAEAYDAYLRGRFLVEKRTPQSAEKSLEYFERAIELDPDFAPAYARLSYAYWSLGALGGRPTKEVFPKAKETAAKALALDPTLADAHATLGLVDLNEWDWKGAEAAFGRAVELDPNSAFAHNGYAQFLMIMRRSDEAIAESRRAVALEPASVLYNRDLVLSLYFARRYDEAIAQSRRTLELDPIMPTAYRWLAKSCERRAFYDQAVEAWLKSGEFSLYDNEERAALRNAYASSGWRGFWRKSLELMKDPTRRGKENYAMAEAYARLGERDRTLAWLEKAYDQARMVKFLNADPHWDDLRSDPRFVDLVRRMGLEP